MDDRAARLLGTINQKSKIIEIGPSVSPIAPRSEGWNVTVVDHATKEELIEKYRPLNKEVERIEHVDVIWASGYLHEAISAELHGTFDVLIASHVIEHVPDPIAFMKSATLLLKPKTGKLVLAVPDKRWCFDCLRQVSTTGEFLAAHQKQGGQKHGLAARFDFPAYIAFDGERGGWGRENLPGLRLTSSLEYAYKEFLQFVNEDEDAAYADCHGWTFTPASFELLILELGALEILDWRISWLGRLPGVEFFVKLSPGAEKFHDSEEREARRFQLLKDIHQEVREQTNWLLGVNPVIAFILKIKTKSLNFIARFK